MPASPQTGGQCNAKPPASLYADEQPGSRDPLRPAQRCRNMHSHAKMYSVSHIYFIAHLYRALGSLPNTTHLTTITDKPCGPCTEHEQRRSTARRASGTRSSQCPARGGEATTRENKLANKVRRRPISAVPSGQDINKQSIRRVFNAHSLTGFPYHARDRPSSQSRLIVPWAMA